MSETISVSVTNLSEFVSRSGDLSGGSYGSVSGIEGTRLHIRIFNDLKKQYKLACSTEEQINWTYDSPFGLNLNVRGRIDALILEKNKDPHIFEIKSFNSTRNSFKALVRDEHLTQLKLYGAMYLFNNTDVLNVTLTLRYVSVTTLEAYEDTFVMGYEDAEEFWEQVCSEYADFAIKLIDYRRSMLDSVTDLKFPYPKLRAGQKEFMKRTLIALTSKEALFVEAPTGTGKTISTLYPAVKGLIRNQYDQIFYLTGKQATRSVACKAINDMRANGLLIRSMLLINKEQICPYKTLCDSKFCPLAKDFYTRLKPALREVILYDELTPEVIKEIAGKHKICPHELMVESMKYCSVVIGDYNHIFHPRVSLMSDELDDGRTVVLADEAHNMIDRSRDMFSASISLSLIDKMIADFKGINPKIESLLLGLRQYFDNINMCFISKSSVFKTNEDIDERKILMTDNWEGTREPPRKLYAKLWYTIHELSPVLDNMKQGTARQTAMEFFFESRYFLTILELYFDNAYITCASRAQNGDIILNLNCLDASQKMDRIIKDRLAAVFFSATLSPFEYYRNCIVGKDADYVSFLKLSSPFPSENLEIMIDTDISTTYKNRYQTKEDLIDRITNCFTNRMGNFMVFFSSFEYMNMIMPEVARKFELLTETEGIPYKVICQFPDMSNEDKTEFLSSFSERFAGVLLGACVLGGNFGEGIDLVGDRLSGVIIVGTGMPKITPERQILANYYSDKLGDGFAFAYRFPGWQKVLQAVGRVIRTEEDTGFALLIDDRLDKPEYISLYPEHWKI